MSLFLWDCCNVIAAYVYILVPYKRWSSGLQSGERHGWDLSLVLCCHLLSEVWFSLPICRLKILIKYYWIQNSTELSHSVYEETRSSSGSLTRDGHEHTSRPIVRWYNLITRSSGATQNLGPRCTHKHTHTHTQTHTHIHTNTHINVKMFQMLPPPHTHTTTTTHTPLHSVIAAHV